MDRDIQQRLQWVKLYKQSGDAGFVCRRCGISRPTLRKWWRHYQLNGVEGLHSQSRRPLSSPATKAIPNMNSLYSRFEGKEILAQEEYKVIYCVNMN